MTESRWRWREVWQRTWITRSTYLGTRPSATGRITAHELRLCRTDTKLRWHIKPFSLRSRHPHRKTRHCDKTDRRVVVNCTQAPARLRKLRPVENKRDLDFVCWPRNDAKLLQLLRDPRANKFGDSLSVAFPNHWAARRQY